MKKNILLIFFLLGVNLAFCQSTRTHKPSIGSNHEVQFNPIAADKSQIYRPKLTIQYLNWSDPAAFAISPSPTITGYGEYSDSLSKALGGKTFFAIEDQYYPIESWADYYYWYTKKFWFKFKNPELYEYYYLSNNDFAMASYIVSRLYLGKFYPSLIRIDFLDLNVELNRLDDEKYWANDDGKLKKMKRDFEVKEFDPPANRINNAENIEMKNHENRDIDRTREQRVIQLDKKNSSNVTIDKLD